MARPTRSTNNRNQDRELCIDEINSPKKLLRLLNYEQDNFEQIHISKSLKVPAKQSNYNKFKRILKSGINWRDLDEFKAKVKLLQITNWVRSRPKQLALELCQYRKVFTESSVTLRPLVNYPEACGVFAVREIPENTILTGLVGHTKVKGDCPDSRIGLHYRFHKNYRKSGIEHLVLDGPLYFVNHSETPNCQWVLPRKLVGRHVFIKIKTIKRVLLGDQITVSYGENYFEDIPLLLNYE